MKKLTVMASILLMAFTASAHANLLSGTWTTYEAGWGSGTFSNMSASSVTIDTNGGSNVAYQLLNVTPGETYTLSGTVAGNGSSHWTEVLLFEYNGENLAGGDGIDAPAPDANIQLKTDGFGLNPSVYPGPTAFDVNVWGYPNNPSPSLDITPAGNQIVVALKAGASGGSNHAEFTNVSLVPEPTALALMVVGFLPLLRRRKA